MKYILILCIMLSSASSYASCLETVWQNYKWNNGSAAFKECIVKSDEFVAASQTILCDPKSGKISDKYIKFLGYQSKFKKIIAEHDAEQSPAQREYLNDEARAVEGEWIVLGYKYEIYEVLHNVFEKESECASKY